MLEAKGTEHVTNFATFTSDISSSKAADTRYNKWLTKLVTHMNATTHSQAMFKVGTSQIPFRRHQQGSKLWNRSRLCSDILFLLFTYLFYVSEYIVLWRRRMPKIRLIKERDEKYRMSETFRLNVA